MPKFTARLLIIFLYACVAVLMSSSLLKAETALFIPEIQDKLNQYSEQQGVLLNFKLMDRQCREGIKKAAIKVRQSRNSNELRYFQMEYIEQRSDHVKTVVVHTIRLIKIQDSFLEKISRNSNRHTAFTRSDQVNGMKSLMQMALLIDSQTGPVWHEKNGDKALFLISGLHQDIETYVLATFLIPPSTSDPDFQQQIKNIRTRLYKNLKNLRLEFVYLDEKLQQISTEDKYES